MINEALEVIAGTRRWAVVEGDCLEVIPALPRGFVLITDPPYGVGLGTNAGSGGKHGIRHAAYYATELRDALTAALELALGHGCTCRVATCDRMPRT